jgi:hypothetical protein
MKKFIITCIATLGVFIYCQTPLLSQSTVEQKAEKEKQTELEIIMYETQKAQKEAQARAERAQRRAVEVARVGRDWSYIYNPSGENTTRLTLSKHFDNESRKLKGNFSVEQDAKMIKLQLHGEVDRGMIELILSLPGGKVFKTLTISEAADMSWSQTITVKEEEKKYFGNWSYEVIAEEADGNYHLSLHTY